MSSGNECPVNHAALRWITMPWTLGWSGVHMLCILWLKWTRPEVPRFSGPKKIDWKGQRFNFYLAIDVSSPRYKEAIGIIITMQCGHTLVATHSSYQDSAIKYIINIQVAIYWLFQKPSFYATSSHISILQPHLPLNTEPGDNLKWFHHHRRRWQWWRERLAPGFFNDEMKRKINIPNKNH